MKRLKECQIVDPGCAHDSDMEDLVAGTQDIEGVGCPSFGNLGNRQLVARIGA